MATARLEDIAALLAGRLHRCADISDGGLLALLFGFAVEQLNKEFELCAQALNERGGKHCFGFGVHAEHKRASYLCIAL